MVRTRSRKTNTDIIVNTLDVIDEQSPVQASHVSSTSTDEKIYMKNLLKQLKEDEKKLGEELKAELARMDRELQLISLGMPVAEQNAPAFPPDSNASSKVLPRRKLSSMEAAFDPKVSSTSHRRPRPEGLSQGTHPDGDAVEGAEKFAISTLRAVDEEAKPLEARRSRSRTRKAVVDSTTVTKQAPRARDYTPQMIPDSSVAKRTRSRSLSRGLHVSGPSIIYQTPRVGKDSVAATPITPKVDPYKPISIKRMPRQDELAISISGSPLMTQPGTGSEPNISLPVGETVLCIMPTEGPCPDISDIDVETKVKLRQLRDNLDHILKG